MTFRDYPITLRYALEPVQMGSCYLFVIFSTSSQSQSPPGRAKAVQSYNVLRLSFLSFLLRLPQNLLRSVGRYPTSSFCRLRIGQIRWRWRESNPRPKCFAKYRSKYKHKLSPTDIMLKKNPCEGGGAGIALVSGLFAEADRYDGCRLKTDGLIRGC